MTQGHSYAAQAAAFYIALVPFALLFTMMIGARFFENVRRSRKPAPARPPALGLAGFAPMRGALRSAE